MILSKGRVSFLGEAALASRHFSEMGYVCPEVMNPAEYFLDVVNPSFSGEERVDRMVDTWEVKAAFDGVYGDKRGEGSDETGMLIISSSCARELLILLRRQGSSMLWDPALYLGRCVALLVTNLFIACMYWKTREVTQEQALNLAWLVIWLYTIPCTCK